MTYLGSEVFLYRYHVVVDVLCVAEVAGMNI